MPEYVEQGVGKVRLDQNDFVAQGGFGSVYVRGKKAYKIYIDPKNMIPLGKIDELAGLTDPNIIRPLAPLLEKATPVGYSMLALDPDNTYILNQLFPKAFRQRTGLTPDLSLGLVRKLQGLVKHCHTKGVHIVDLNELNELVSKDFKELFLLDMDNCQTKSYPPQGLMESVRDRHAPLIDVPDRKNPGQTKKIPKWGEGTDWFSFAVVAVQLFIGIHPYDGRHPVHGKNRDKLMQLNVSVVNPDVTCPQGVVLPLDVIPEVYLRWLEAVLERGERIPPPDSLVTAIQVITKVQQTVSSFKLDIQKLSDHPDPLLAYYHSQINPVVVTAKHIYLGQNKVGNTTPTTVVAHTPQMARPVAASVNAGKLSLVDLLTGKPLRIDLDVSGITVSDGRLYAHSVRNLVEIKFIEMQSSTLPTPKVVGTCLEKATSVYDGVIMQNLLGKNWCSVFPAPDVHHQKHLKELDGYRVIDARYQNLVLQVIAVDQVSGEYSRFVVRFAPTFATYDTRQIKGITPTDLNFVVRDNGICVQITEEADIEVFSNSVGSNQVSQVQDPNISVDMKLFCKGAQVVFTQDNQLFVMTMKR